MVAPKNLAAPLNIGVSKDDRQTWELMETIEEDLDGSYCYTDIHFTEKNVLIAYFDWATRQTTVMCLSRAWVYN